MYTIVGADGQNYGPVSAEQLRQWIAEGRANAQTRVLVEGSPDWKLVSELPEFASETGIRAAPQKTPEPLRAPAPAPFSFGPTPKTNSLAVTSLVLGILSLTLGCCCYGLPFNVAGIICSVVALSQNKNDPVNQQGKGLAIAGLVLSIFSILLIGLLVIFGVASHWTDALRRMKL